MSLMITERRSHPNNTHSESSSSSLSIMSELSSSLTVVYRRRRSCYRQNDTNDDRRGCNNETSVLHYDKNSHQIQSGDDSCDSNSNIRRKNESFIRHLYQNPPGMRFSLITALLLLNVSSSFLWNPIFVVVTAFVPTATTIAMIPPIVLLDTRENQHRHNLARQRRRRVKWSISTKTMLNMASSNNIDDDSESNKKKSSENKSSGRGFNGSDNKSKNKKHNKAGNLSEASKTPESLSQSPSSSSSMRVSTNSGEKTASSSELSPTTTAAAESSLSTMELELMMQRITQLESMVSSQQVVIRKLSEQCRELAEATKAFAGFIQLLRDATPPQQPSKIAVPRNTNKDNDDIVGADDDDDDDEDEDDDDDDENIESGDNTANKNKNRRKNRHETIVEAFEDTNIFGTAPETVLEAADVAGASILSGILAGQQRMLVDVRDAELNQSAETFVQFLELAVLPVAAGLEGLRGPRNRLKLVFPTVGELLQYRKTMCLSAPEVVALSTLGFDPVESQDNMVVMIAPAPDDDEGLAKMNELLQLPPPTNDDDADDLYDEYGRRKNMGIAKPVVVLNRHMVPITGPAADFEVAYHLRLLSVQYMSGEQQQQQPSSQPPERSSDTYAPLSTQDVISTTTKSATSTTTPSLEQADTSTQSESQSLHRGNETHPLDDGDDGDVYGSDGDIAYNSSALLDTSEQVLEEVLKHAHEQYDRRASSSYGITRAMVIRAYPHPWNIFVDTSPDDTTADFEVAAVFDSEPTSSEIHDAIVSCLEGSEQEDEVVAQQMQQAFEAGQLDRISELLSKVMDNYDDNIDDDDEPYQGLFGSGSEP